MSEPQQDSRQIALFDDQSQLRSLLEQTLEAAYAHLSDLDQHAPATPRPAYPLPDLPEDGIGGAATLARFTEQFGAEMAASAGPRYWGFVTGGTTPAALMGDWLVSAFDINLADRDNSAAPAVEIEAIHLLRQLFGLPDHFGGVFVSGATMSNLLGLALGREWVAQQHGIQASQDGLYDTMPIKVLSAAPHSSAIKAMAILGMGRKQVEHVDKLGGNREAIDVADLERRLATYNGQPCIVIASAGTVNTVDFDDISAIAALKQRYPFWLHVDGAFGGFAACSPRFQHLMAGVELADSVTIDGHKWLNVPYDSAMFFTPHQALQAQVFQNAAAYLPDLGPEPDFFHLTPENSRRFRALPAWFTLVAYGKAGYAEIVERNCRIAHALGERIAASESFRLLAPVRMNVVCFTVNGMEQSSTLKAFIRALRDDGRLFVTPTVYNGVAGLRAALCNWRTQDADLEIGWQALQDVAAALRNSLA